MKTKIYSLLLFCAVIMFAQNANAQCGARYHDKMFSVSPKTTVKYSTPYNLSMDIYQPSGDTATSRPVIILAHGGSFLQGSTKTSDPYVVTMCQEFAKRGYVTASIDYRVASYLDMLDSAKAVPEVLRAISDGKAAIRFFRQDAANSNTYRINPNLVFIGGNSAGAVLYMHVIYLDSLGEVSTDFQNFITANGGFEGNSGNPGYSSEATALINLAGGLNIPTFVGPNSKPSFNAQGDQDATVPYGCANAQSGFTNVRLCGLGAIEPLYNQYSVNHVSIVYPGEGHVPWENGPNAAAEATQLDTSIANFLMQFVCTNDTVATNINNVYSANSVSLYPNPAKTELHISFTNAANFKSIQLIDALGRLVEEKIVSDNSMTISRKELSSGIYLVKFTAKDASVIVKKVMFE